MDQGRSRSPDPRGPRGIRSGRRARRRRTAYLEHAGENAPVIRPGGVQRPLGTNRFWCPSPDSVASEASDITGEEGAIQISESEGELETDFRPSSSEPSRFEPVPVPAAPQVHLTQPVTRPLRPQPPKPPLPRIALPEDVRAYRWDHRGFFEEFSLESPPSSKLTGVAICIDWHQVTDVHRTSARSAVHISDDGLVPPQNLAVYQRLHSSHTWLAVLSYVHTDYTRNRLLRAASQSQLHADLILVTPNPTGRRGKLATLRAVFKGPAVLVDDKVEVLNEAFEGGVFCIHIKVPKRRNEVALLHEGISSVTNLSEAEVLIRGYIDSL